MLIIFIKEYNTLVILLFTVILILSIKPLSAWAKEYSRSSDGASWGIVGMIWGAVSIPLIVRIIYLQDTVMGFVNPEYGAIMQIMDWAKAAVK